jgi:hypothetical protein
MLTVGSKIFKNSRHRGGLGLTHSKLLVNSRAFLTTASSQNLQPCLSPEDRRLQSGLRVGPQYYLMISEAHETGLCDVSN